MTLEQAERSRKNPELIYIVRNVFPETDSKGQRGRLYEILLPGDEGYQATDDRLKRWEVNKNDNRE